ncbi:TIGR01777 family oxidoreductase [Paenibacillus spongiae]|uniref:TIGR01777 family oxidoreductase n=1 Tax=Paenibacillus spongiae TaxID=2909671 RepID=A0ABY5SBU3_9BACL|nr:TIGR01777 family oxidoreductase [Paenibacillus spongiae]UVI31426.1 TIGR01777 family oxidoreductase [Paenibacillus spongiae]
MKIAVTGGTGFVGSDLVKALLRRGDDVWVISRRSSSSAGKTAPHSGAKQISWEELEQSPSRLEGVEAIVNLAGESINQRWNDEAKKRILQSRIDAAQRIANLIDALDSKPSVVVNASGISIYGTSETDTFNEESDARLTDFLGTVVEKWEAAADRIPVPRLVKLRVSVVLGRNGGAFPLMAMPYRMFAGGRVGSGKQWLSWIHIEDMTRLLLFCIDNTSIRGAVNASSPDPVTNDHFGRSIAAAMGRPHWFPVPAFMMKTLFGEMSTLLLEGQRVLPHKALTQGFEFRYPSIAEAAEELVGKSKHSSA